MQKTKIIVVGAGFAGIHLVRKLDENLFDVLLIDKINHHQFQPLFYQVATSQLEPSSISFPLRNIFKHKKNVQIRLANVQAVDVNNKTIITNIGNFNYHYLVLAMGCTTNFYGNQNIANNSFTLKSTYDAIAIRNHILLVFEQIITATEPEKLALFNIVIVGAGATGVELAGAFAEIKKNVLPSDYPGIDFSRLSIILIEGSNYTLNSMSDFAKKASEVYLKEMDIKLLKETFVKDYNSDILTLQNGNTINTKTVIWAAGVIANTIEGIPANTVFNGNRLKVDSYNKLDNCNDIFVVGDMALMKLKDYPKGHPQLASVANQQAANLAINFKKNILKKTLQPFRYNNLGSMATIGTHKAVVDLPFINFKGFLAWITWMLLHLMLILNVKNKLIIFINWAWAYISKNTSLRLILTPTKKINLDKNI